MEAQRELLNALLGNHTVNDFRDKTVCKNFLCAFCPYQLFANTKLKIGNCDLIHDPRLRQQFIVASQTHDYQEYYNDFEITLKNIKDSCDLKMKRGQHKMTDKKTLQVVDVEEGVEVKQITKNIEELKLKIEQASEEGEADEADYLINILEKLKSQKQILQAEYLVKLSKNIPNLNVANVNEKLKVCSVCGAILDISDSRSRLSDHFNGKIHNAYILINQKLEELKEKRMKYYSENCVKKMKEKKSNINIDDYISYEKDERDALFEKCRSPNRPEIVRSKSMHRHYHHNHSISSSNHHHHHHHHHSHYSSNERYYFD